MVNTIYILKFNCNILKKELFYVFNESDFHLLNNLYK